MSKKSGPQVTGGSLSDRIRSSLVLKLNFRIQARLLSAFLFVNILFSTLLLWTLWLKADAGAQQFIDGLGSVGVESGGHPVAAGGYRALRTEDNVQGFLLPEPIQQWLPLDALNVRRQVRIADMHRTLPLAQRIQQAEYRILVTIDDIQWLISYPLGGDIRLFVVILLILLGAELFYLLRSFAENSWVIRDALRPLSEMAEKARSLHAGMSSMEASADGTGIRHLAGAISKIDAKQLDRRLSVDGSQNELKDLAHAINDMLNRISQSYESQVRFVSDASHELRTPISVIQGYANLLDRWGKHDEKTMQESVEAIKSEAENMKGLVEQLLFLARGDSETIQLHRSVFDSCDMVEEIIKETRLIDPVHVFETRLERPAFLEADQQLIKQAIRILIDNSIKYTPPGGEIILRVSSDKENVRIVVQDNGIGIAPADVPHVFDRFYRSDESRARKTGGSGLGLAIAKWIVERHGGHFEVLSRLDIGTRTTIVLPAAWTGAASGRDTGTPLV
jgi:signal transduction histidine kinase